jgi:hypothetical protein
MGMGKGYYSQRLMMNRTSFLVTVLLLSMGFFLASCQLDPNERFIQGIWEFANEQGDERSGRAHVFQRWEFREGRFYFIQQVSTPETVEGYYRVIASEEDRIGLEIYGLQGTIEWSDPGELWLAIDREDDTLRVQRTLYLRVSR